VKITTRNGVRTLRSSGRRLACLVAAGGAALLVSASALAANVTATATITGGTLSLASSAAPTFSVTLNGTDQTPSYTMPMTVNDATGSGTGWNVTITSTAFTTGTKSLANGASTVTGVTSSCAALTTCTSPTNATGYPLTVPAAASPPVAVKLFNAAANTGLGNFTLTPTVQVAIPANTFAGTYTSTITLAVVSGP
jgi:WxL domain surface cell wall-binding